jgi:hypothetical protein
MTVDGPTWGYYLRGEHRLIRRHYESITLCPDNTAFWEMQVDFELPTIRDAGYEDDSDKPPLFLFPLIYLKKADPRIKFNVVEPGQGPVPFPIRTECDAISTVAIQQAIQSLARRSNTDQSSLDEADLKSLTRVIAAAKPFVAALALRELEAKVGLGDPGAGTQPGEPYQRIGELIESSGVRESLEMMVEHTLLWVTLRGEPHERRSIVVSQEISINRRSLTRWSFGRLPTPTLRRTRGVVEHAGSRWTPTRRFLEWAQHRRARHPELTIGEHRYGRRDRRFRFSVLSERLGQPLVCLPFETIVPTIYTKRCRSYHFEFRAPEARTPRDLKVSFGPSLAEPPEHDPAHSAPESKHVRTTLTPRAARLDMPWSAIGKPVNFRITVGVGNGAFPILWFLAAAITATMLWVFAAAKPEQDSQTAVAILLVVPALVAGLAVSSNEVQISELPGGSRLLLLVAGISALVAALPLGGAEPFHMKPTWMWVACATAATAASVPLATSWLLSRPATWRRLMELKTRGRQELALILGILLSLALTVALYRLERGLVPRGAIAVTLFAVAIFMATMASNRAALEMNETRHYIGLSFLLAGSVCLALGCIELCAIAKGDPKRLQEWAERASFGILLFASVSGDLLNFATSFGRPRRDEVHVSPLEGRALLEGNSVRVLPILFDRERKAGIRNHEPSVETVKSG